ncbi:MAG TPA: hypothetical protein VKV06_07705 [Acidimicrobiales bacterium]|nr:hypothetical protein [Acidimicrobiales bacterium]
MTVDSSETAADRTPNVLIGKGFVGDYEHQWQGRVLGEAGPGVFLCEFYSWSSGAPYAQKLVPAGEMAGWSFYDDPDDWRHAADEASWRWSRKARLGW